MLSVSFVVLCIIFVISDVTITGVEVKFKNQVYPIIIDVNHIPELTGIETTSTGVRVGASVSLSSMDSYLKGIIQAEPGRVNG